MPRWRSSASTRRVRGLRNVKEKSVGPAKTEEIADALIMIDRVHIERRQRDVVGVEQPGAFARALPGVFAEVFGEISRDCTQTRARGLVEADAHRRAARRRGTALRDWPCRSMTRS